MVKQGAKGMEVGPDGRECPTATENWLRQRAREAPHRVALDDGARRLTFAQLHDLALGHARRLLAAAQGSREVSGNPAGAHAQAIGTRAAFLAGNSLDYAVWLAAAQAAGIQAVPLNVRLSVPELLAQTADCRPAILLCDRANLSKALEVSRAPGGAAPRVSTFSEAESLPPCNDATPGGAVLETYDLDRIADVVYTSGSTGTPKGVVQTFGNHWHSAMNCRANLGFRPDRDIWGCPVPFFHMSGFSILMRCLVCGVGVRLYDGFDPRLLNDDALAGNITCLSAVTYQIERMLDDLDARPDRPTYPTGLRFVLQGGGPVPLATLERCERAAMPVVSSFGMTETASQVVALSPEDAARKHGSVGRPLGGVDLRIAPLDGSSDEGVPTGEVGRILLTGPTLAVGYLNQPERYAASFTEHGWFDTGDLGSVDDEGYLHIASRRADLIISGGENVYPAEVEAIVVRHPRVADVAVAGIADPVWGDVPVAVCVPADGTDDLPTDEEMRAFCRTSLAPYKCPRHTVWVDELPVTASGKPQRPRAAELARALLARRGA